MNTSSFGHPTASAPVPHSSAPQIPVSPGSAGAPLPGYPASAAASPPDPSAVVHAVWPAPADSSAPEQLTYFQLSRRTRGWWRPLATLGVFLVVTLGLFVGLMLVTLFVPGLTFFASDELDMSNPVDAAIGSAMLALFIPAAVIATRLTGRGGTIHSVTGRLRWGLLGSSLALALVPVVLSVVATWPLDPIVPSVSASTLGLVLVGLLIIPLQAAGEEYLFRGILMQAVGHWLRAPIWGLLISLPLFVFGHDYDAWGLAFTGLFAAAATWLTWRTGGLEAAIALHVVNNSVVIILGAFGLTDLNATEISWTSGLVATAIPLGFALLFAWWWQRTDGDARYARTVPAFPRPHEGEATDMSGASMATSTRTSSS